MEPFRIIAPQPVITHSTARATSFDEIFPRLIGENTPGAHLIWNGIAIRLNYNYDAYRNILNIAQFVAKITGSDSGSEKITLMTEMLFVEWQIRWNQTVNIEAKFMSRKEDWNHYANVLNEQRTAEIPKESFIREWQKWLKALNQVVQSVNLTGFEEEQIVLDSALQKSTV